MKSKWIRAIASLMTSAVLFAQMPVMTLNAQQTNTKEASAGAETSRTETESSETETGSEEEENHETRSEEEENHETGSEETGSDEAGSEETESDEARPKETENDEAHSTESETIEESETSEIESTETEPETKSTENDSSKIRYILGREMTPEEIAEQEAMVPDYMPELEVEELPDSNPQIDTYDLRAEELPETYDARENGAIPAVKNQNPWGTCWAFSFLTAMENSLVRQHYASVDEIDLSERHLAYFDYHTGYDALDNANDDRITTSPQNYYLKTGGNNTRAVSKIMNWQGAAMESKYPYSASLPADLEQSSAQDVAYTLKGCYFISTSDLETAERVQTVKELIMEYDCVSWSYYHTSTFYNASTAAYFNNEVETTNHAITVVGWDDTYSKENFKTSPENDGAWIVRNSWGSEWGDNGYFYVSYEDVSMGCGNAACVVTADKAGIYDNNYFHGNVSSVGAYGKYRKVAQIYQAKSPNASREKLSAVSFMISSAAADYSIQIYKNPERIDGVIKDPESGTPMLTEPLEGVTTYAGVYTVELPEPVLVDSGDEMAIVISFPENKAYMYCDINSSTSSSTGSCEAVNATEPGESMYMLGSSWADYSASNRSLRINALTTDVVTTPELSVSYDGNAAVLTWKGRCGADHYKLERKAPTQQYYETIATIADSGEQQYTVTDDMTGMPLGDYEYRLSVIKDTECSDWTQETLTRDLIAEHLAHDKMKLTWLKVDGAATYSAAILIGNTWKKCQTKATEYTFDFSKNDYEVRVGDDYEYRVTAYDERGNLIYTSSTVKQRTAPDTPRLSVSYGQASGMKIQWNQDTGAAQADLYRSTSAGEKGELIAVAAAAEGAYVDKSALEYGKNYFYRAALWIENSSGEKVYAAITEPCKGCMIPAAPELSSAVYQEPVVRLQWSESVGAEGYFVERSDNSDTFHQLAQLEGTDILTYTDSGIAKANTYEYRITAYNTDSDGKVQCSAGSQSRKVTVNPEPVELTQITEKKGTVLEVMLPVVENAQSYTLYRSENNKDFALIADQVTDSTYIDSDVQPDTTYYYKVLVTVNGISSRLVDTNAASITTKPLLTGLSLSVAEKDMLKDSSQELMMSAEPAHYPYHEEIMWSAFDEEGHSLSITENQGSIVVSGKDGKEILRITDNQITATGASEDKTVRLEIAIEEIKTECTVSIYENGFWVSGVKDQVYTGKALTPKIRVYDKSRLLTEGTDYSVSYKNNTNVNESSDSAKVPTIVVTGKGNYSGTQVVTFQILPENIAGEAFRADDIVCAYDSKKVQHPVPELYRNGVKLKYNKDFTTEYPETAQDAYTAVGSYKILIKGKGNFSGTREVSLTITDEGLISKATVSKVKDQTYTGNPIEPKLTVKLGKTVLVENQDYTVEYENNIAAGTATATITGNGTTCHGMKRVSFKIVGTSIKKATVAGLEKSLVYTGDAVEQTGYQLSIRTASGTKTLSKGTDYQVSYANNTNVGTASIIFTGINGYSGTLKKTYKITPYDIHDDSAKQLTIELSKKVPYAKGGSRPEPVVTFGGNVLTYGTDYKMSYKNNKAASAGKVPEVTVTGIKNFKGTRTLTFEIAKQDIGMLTMNVSDKVYSKKAGAYKPKLSVVDLDGKVLIAGKDYAKTFHYTYDAPTTLADGSIRSKGEAVGDKDIIPSGTVLNVTITGMNNYTGTLTGRYRITEYDLSKAKVKVENQIYTGKAIEPDENDIRVTFKGKELVCGTDYIIEGYADNVKKGNAKVILRGIGQYGGTKTAVFRIKSKTVVWWK